MGAPRIVAVGSGAAPMLLGGGSGSRVFIGEARTLGVVGSVVDFALSVSSVVASFIDLWMAALLSVVGLAGSLLVYLGVSKLSRAANDERMRVYYLIYFILIAIATLIPVPLIPVVGELPRLFMSPPRVAAPMLAAIILIHVIDSVLTAIGTWYLKNCYDAVKTHVKVEMFGVAGLLYFIGGVLTIIVVGALIMIIAAIIEIIAWASTPEYIEAGAGAALQPRLV